MKQNLKHILSMESWLSSKSWHCWNIWNLSCNKPLNLHFNKCFDHQVTFFNRKTKLNKLTIFSSKRDRPYFLLKRCVYILRLLLMLSHWINNLEILDCLHYSLKYHFQFSHKHPIISCLTGFGLIWMNLYM